MVQFWYSLKKKYCEAVELFVHTWGWIPLHLYFLNTLPLRDALFTLNHVTDLLRIDHISCEMFQQLFQPHTTFAVFCCTCLNNFQIQNESTCVNIWHVVSVVFSIKRGVRVTQIANHCILLSFIFHRWQVFVPRKKYKVHSSVDNNDWCKRRIF